MTETALVAVEDRKQLALLKAVGLDRLAPEQRELALNIAQRYDLDLLLKHIVMIEGRAYITRDGLLHIAHRSGVLDGIETTEPEIVGEYWHSTCSVYRKDMSRPFTYGGRYPTKGGNQKFAPEMAVKVGEVMALRRAFDVSAPAAEERWDTEIPVASESAKAPSLAERVAARPSVATTVEPDGAVTVEVVASDAPEPFAADVEANSETLRPPQSAPPATPQTDPAAMTFGELHPCKLHARPMEQDAKGWSCPECRPPRR